MVNAVLQRVWVREIYRSIQGESSFSGWPCIFVRLTGCDLRCSYCDSAYAFSGGRSMRVREVCEQVASLAQPFGAPDGPAGHPLVEVTGGEPLLQKGVFGLMRLLCDRRYTVLIETSGAHDIRSIDPRVRRIVDLKCPSSGEMDRILWGNLRWLRSSDEIKFVLRSWEDYQWMKDQMDRYQLESICPLLVSWAIPPGPSRQDPSLKVFPAGHHAIGQRELVQRIIADALPVRFQLQVHKYVWPPDQTGV